MLIFVLKFKGKVLEKVEFLRLKILKQFYDFIYIALGRK